MNHDTTRRKARECFGETKRVDRSLRKVQMANLRSGTDFGDLHLFAWFKDRIKRILRWGSDDKKKT